MMSTKVSPGKFARSFASECSDLVEQFVHVVSHGRSPQAFLDSQQDCIYAKTAEGQVVFANQSEQETFGGRVWIVGRYDNAFLSENIAPVAKASDCLLKAGCRQIEFEHVGTDVRGRKLLLRTFKYSLAEMEIEQIAVFGVTRILEVYQEAEASPTKDLWDRWQAFQRLDAQEVEVAVRMVRGEKVREIAGALQVASRTIDNRRASILKKLEITNPYELTALMVRLQDSGYIDFGI